MINMKLPSILYKVIYMQAPDPKEFNWAQFIFSAFVYLIIYFWFAGFLSSSCTDWENSISKKLLYLWAGLLSVHLSYYQSSNTVWDWTFYPSGPPGFRQICTYLLLLILPTFILDC